MQTPHLRDATSGGSTYPGGRVLRTGDPAADGRLVRAAGAQLPLRPERG